MATLTEGVIKIMWLKKLTLSGTILLGAILAAWAAAAALSAGEDPIPPASSQRAGPAAPPAPVAASAPGTGSGTVPLAKPSEPFPLDLAFSRRDFSYFEKAAVSPDGSRVAYAVVTPMKRREDVWTLESGLPAVFRGARLHVAEVATGKAIPLGAEGATSFAPAWSPDGTRLAYYSDEGGSLRAWIFDAGKGTSAPAADLRVKVHYHMTTVMPPTWSPDGRTLLVPALPAAEVGADPRPPRGRCRDRPGEEAAGRPLVLASGE